MGLVTGLQIQETPPQFEAFYRFKTENRNVWRRKTDTTSSQAYFLKRQNQLPQQNGTAEEVKILKG